MLPYAPFLDTRNAPDQIPDPTELERIKARLFLASTPGDPASDHALGLFYLTQHDYENAIHLLKSAVLAKPRKAQFYNDLAAAILEKAKRDRDRSQSGADTRDSSTTEFDECLRNLRRALEMDSNFTEALFNRALCHQFMGLPQAASEDWTDYLRRDSASGWSGEAMFCLDRLNRAKVSLGPDSVLADYLEAFREKDKSWAWQTIGETRDVNGSLVENDLLKRYIRCKSEGDASEALNTMRALRYASILEIVRAKDRFQHDLARWHESVRPATEITVLEARGLETKADQLFITENKFEEARALYARAEAIFRAVGDTPEASFTKYRIAHCYLRRSSTVNEALRTLVGLRPFFEVRRYTWLLARCLAGLADGYVSLGYYSLAIDCSAKALRLLDIANDNNGVLRILCQLADEFRKVGKEPEALAFVHRALSLAGKPGIQVRNLWGAYTLMMKLCRHLGLDDAGLAYEEELIRLLPSVGAKALYLSRSHADLAVHRAALGHLNEAIHEEQRAFDIAKNGPDKDTANNIMAYSALSLGQIYRSAGDFDKASASYDLAIQLYEGLKLPAYLLEAHKGRFLSLIAQGDDARAGEELETTVALLEESRGKILDEGNKDSFFETAQEVYDLAVDFKYSKIEDPSGAFSIVEISRARSLHDLTASGMSLTETPNGSDLQPNAANKPLTFREVQEGMQPGSQILEYSLLADKVVIWVVAKDSLHTAVKNIPQSALEKTIAQYFAAIAGPAEDVATAMARAEELYDVLVEPVSYWLDTEKEICIVPDKSLCYLPFHALRSRSHGTYLIEDYVITYAPSSSIYVSCSKLGRMRNGPLDEKLLSIGNPSFDRKVFANLPPLQGAEREAVEICRYYHNSPPLVGRKAVKSAVIREMKHADVIELATHCVIDQDSVLHSKLLLAREADPSLARQPDAGVMQALEIYKLELPRTRLVVLSACRTAVERSLKGEGAVGMARPFIALGVPLVVATLWPVDSDSAADLMVDFHRLRKEGHLSSSRALRNAQLNMLRAADAQSQNPLSWAAFIVIGGSCNF